MKLEHSSFQCESLAGACPTAVAHGKVNKMAKVKLNPVMEKIHGKIGDLVFRRYEDEIVVARKPDRQNVEPTPAQAAHRERFRLAALYGKTVFADPAQKALYEKGAKDRHQTVFALTVGDFLNAPAVDEIDLSAYTGKAGEPITIRASDDFEVAGVYVAIRDTCGAVLEQAAACQSDGVWLYTTTKALTPGLAVVIEVTATDRPGNKTVRTQARN
jgi:hypothetical protein